MSVTVAPSSAKAITAFTIPNQIGTATINESAHTIALTMPAGTNVTALVPAITITGASVSPNTGVAQDFTNSVNYTVTAADASTQVYAVSVSVSLPSMDHLRATSIAPSFPAGSYSDFEIAAFDQLGNVMVDYTGDKSIIFSGANTAPDGTHPTCTDKDGVAINFGSPITITFTDGVGFCWIKLYNAESISVDLSDGAYSTTGNASYDYDVNVVPGNTNAGKTSISVSPTFGTVGTAESIVVMAKDVYGNSRTIGGDVVSISISGANIATPGATDNSEGTYTASYVPANFGTDSIVGTINVNTIGSDTDGTSDGIYYIAIASALSPSKAITAFTIPNQIGTATINESAHTIALTMPAGTNVTALVPAITITGASVSPNTGVAQDFTNSVNYTVTAADTSTQVYAVSVTVAPSSAKSITAFSFGNLAPPVIGTIDNDAGTVALTVSYGTDVTAMVPTVMHTGASVSPASGLAQDFTLPVTYTLTAQDNSTKAYVVTVNMSSAISAPISTIPDNEDYFKDLELSFDSKDVKNKKTSKKEVTLKFKNTDGIKYFKTSHNSHFEKADWEKMEKEINLDIDQQKRDAQKFFFKFKDKNDKTSKTYEKKVTFNPSPYSIFNFPKRGHKGDAMSQSGAGFSPNSRVALYFSGFWGGYYAPVYVDTDEKGSFSLNYKINKVFGWYRWYAVDLKTKTESKTTSYLVY